MYVRDSSTAKLETCMLGTVSLLPVVSKVSEKLVKNRFLGHLEKYGLFSNFLYGFKSSWSTADILTLESDRIFL